MDSMDAFNALWSLEAVEYKKVLLKSWAKCCRYLHFHTLKVLKKDLLFMFYLQTLVDFKIKILRMIFHMEIVMRLNIQKIMINH